MNYILIKGAKHAGKSKTINEICKRLNPDIILKLNIADNGKFFLENMCKTIEFISHNYIITVRSRNILVVADSPTSQRIKISTILETVNKEVKIDFAIIAARGLEKLNDFATTKELCQYGKCIFETKIFRIPAHRFKETEEWNRRISYMVNITLHNL